VGGAFASTGAYVVRAREVPGDASTYAQFSVGATRTGDLHAAGDHDWVAVRLDAGQSYNFQQRGSPTGSGTLADTFLFLRDSSGAIVAQDNDGGVGSNSLINFLASKTGRYYLDASASGSDTGSYELSAGLGFATSDDLLV
jgi:serralysin